MANVNNNSSILTIYILVIVILIIIYIYADTNRQIITGIVSILSGSTIALGLLNYMDNENSRKIQEAFNQRRNYIDFIGGSFDKIDSYYLENPNELNELYYEFYGYSNFPIRDKKGNINLTDRNDTEDKRKVSDIEYIILLKIIQKINIMFITNPGIFDDINFRNKLIKFTRSHKFKEVLSFNKNDFSSEFIEKLNKLKIINSKDIQVEQITIPQIH